MTPLPPGQSGLTVTYRGGAYDYFNSDIATIAAPDTVITSLDFQPANGAYAIADIKDDNGSGFDVQQEVVSPGELQDAVAQDAAKSRVVTAVSFDATGQANLLSYGWQGDTTTQYQTSVVLVTGEQVADAATSLANDGYIITAFGGDVTNGFVLVGTKVQGDTMPRPIIVGTQDSPAATPGWGKGYSPLVYVDYSAHGYTSVVEK